PTIKISDNNGHFHSLILPAKISENRSVISDCKIEGIVFDSNIENNRIQVEQGRGFINIENPENITVENNTFNYHSMNCIYMFGAYQPLKNTIIRNNTFIFNTNSESPYDNTAVYVGTVNHKITDNTFIAEHDFGRTAVETHVNFGVVSDNYVKNYFSGVLVLAQDLPDEHYSYEVTQIAKRVSSNYFDGVTNGITFWDSQGSSFSGVSIVDNIIKIANITRNYNPVSDCYGIALSSGMGGNRANHIIENANISGNIIEFEFDENNIAEGEHLNPVGYDGSFGIGSDVASSSSLFRAKNITITNNQIINSPMQPFSFISKVHFPDEYLNVIVQNNLIENPISFIGTPPDRRVALYVRGNNKNCSFEYNTIVEPKEKNTLIREAQFSFSGYESTNGRIGNNTINDVSGNVVAYKDLPAAWKRASDLEEDVKIKSVSDWSVASGETYKTRDLVTSYEPNSSGQTLIYITEGGTQKGANVTGIYEGDRFVLSSTSDLDKFKGGEYIRV